MKCKICNKADSSYINFVNNEFLCDDCYRDKYTKNKYKDRDRRRKLKYNHEKEGKDKLDKVKISLSLSSLFKDMYEEYEGKNRDRIKTMNALMQTMLLFLEDNNTETFEECSKLMYNLIIMEDGLPNKSAKELLRILYYITEYKDFSLYGCDITLEESKSLQKEAYNFIKDSFDYINKSNFVSYRDQ